MTELDQFRRRLTPKRQPSPQFTHVRLAGGPGSRMPHAVAGDDVRLELGTDPGLPEQVRGFAFDERSGALLGDLDLAVERRPDQSLRIAAKLPARLPTDRLCIVVEGIWPEGCSNGCELSVAISEAAARA